MKTKIPYIIIAVLLAIIGIMQQCREKPKPIITTIIKDSIRLVQVDRWHAAPKPISIIDTFKLPANVDTALILADYYKLRHYSLPIGTDSTGDLTFNTTVQYNQLGAYRITGHYKTYIRTITETKAAESKRKLFIGPTVGGGIGNFSLAASVLYINRQDRAFSVAYDPINKQVFATVYFKIKL